MDILKINQKKYINKHPQFLKEVDKAYKNLKKIKLEKINIKKLKNKKNKKIYLIDISNNETNCFKIRGAYNEVINNKLINAKYLCAASSGSFGISVALSAKLLNKKSIIFAPKNLTKKKKLILKKYDAEIVYSKDYETAKKFAKKNGLKKNYLFIDGLGKNVLYGNGTYLKELYQKKISKFKNNKKLAFIVPLGIGSLAVPVGLYLKHKKINFDLFVVEPKNYGKFFSNLKNNKISKYKPTLADGAAVKILPNRSKVSLMSLVKFVITLNEKEIKKSIQTINKKKIFNKDVEGAGVLSFGSYLFGQEHFKKYDCIFIFITGKNK
mgnify:CR=1 FL=1